MSGNVRTTIMVSSTLADRVSKHVAETGESLTSFYTRAVLNQLENEGDWGIRYELECESNGEEAY